MWSILTNESSRASALSHPLSCIRSRICSHLSCDLSEPIRFAKVSIRSRKSAPSHLLSHPLSHLWWQICDRSVYLSQMRERMWERMRESGYYFWFVMADLWQICLPITNERADAGADARADSTFDLSKAIRCAINPWFLVFQLWAVSLNSVEAKRL